MTDRKPLVKRRLISLYPDQDAVIVKAARRTKRTVSGYLRDEGLNAAEKIERRGKHEDTV